MKTSAIVSLALLVAAACGAPAGKSGAKSDSSATPAMATTTSPKPCDLVTLAELNAGISGETMTEKDATRPGGSVQLCDWLGSGASTTNGNIRIETGGQANYDKIKAMTAPADVMGPLEDLTGIGTAAFAGYHSSSGVGMAVVSFVSGDYIVTVTLGAEETVHNKAALRGMAKDLATKAAGRMK